MDSPSSNPSVDDGEWPLMPTPLQRFNAEIDAARFLEQHGLEFRTGHQAALLAFARWLFQTGRVNQ